MIPLYLATAAFVAGLAVGGGGAWKVQAWRHDSAELKRIEKMASDGRRTAAQIDRAAESFQARQEAADARERDLERRTYAELQKPDSRSACLSDDGLRILTDAAAESNARRGLAPALPASSPAK
jgi:hypothetical protein